MFSVRRRGAARLAAATVVSGLVAAGAIAVAGPAAADEGSTSGGGVSATLGDLAEAGKIDITVKNGKGEEEIRTYRGGLFSLAVNGGGSLKAYCIDLFTPTQSGVKYKEVGWDESTLHDNADAGKIRWILQNSYPQVDDLTALAAKADVKGSLTTEEAATATQAAIWHFSDKIKATPQDAEAKQLAAYLVEKAQKAEDLSEPSATLGLSKGSLAGKAGGRLGPTKVSTNATATVSLPSDTPAGVKVVDKDGKVVTSAKDGDELYIDVPAGTPDGSAKVSLQANTKVNVGRAFASTEAERKQTLILAGSSQSTAKAEFQATWAKQGPVPAVDFKENCAEGGVDITVSNKGDEDWVFELKGVKRTIAAGKSETITVPVAEDSAYKFTIAGPNGFEKVIEGVLDCKTATPGPKPSETPAPSESPATGGSTGSAGTTGSTTGGGDLAETGSSNATPMIAGIAVALVAIGGGAMFFLRKKKAAGQ
ncbi:Cys-Gln thioester bond-forming surface protein [Streptomyces sp. NPDC126499]|uniref:Cys-Gln thioester bond-forming surface protein n=1 Tax=Streptomyces sp. NPDC126499 TaxID=3155314 RepID=UPI0033256448